MPRLTEIEKRAREPEMRARRIASVRKWQAAHREEWLLYMRTKNRAMRAARKVPKELSA